jgi:hypothetical protein
VDDEVEDDDEEDRAAADESSDEDAAMRAVDDLEVDRDVTPVPAQVAKLVFDRSQYSDELLGTVATLELTYVGIACCDY